MATVEQETATTSTATTAPAWVSIGLRGLKRWSDSDPEKRPHHMDLTFLIGDQIIRACIVAPIAGEHSFFLYTDDGRSSQELDVYGGSIEEGIVGAMLSAIWFAEHPETWEGKPSPEEG